MGHKVVCLDCKISFNQGSDFKYIRETDCPNCSKPMILLTHRFKPPKKSENKKWEIIRLLIDKGFHFQRIYDKIITNKDET